MNEIAESIIKAAEDRSLGRIKQILEGDGGRNG